MIMQIYVSKDNQQYGPYTMEELWGFVNSNTFASTDLVCSDGQNWVKISELAGREMSKVKKEEPRSVSGKNKIFMLSAIGIIFVLLATGLFMAWPDDKGSGSKVDSQEQLSRELALLQQRISQEEAFLDEQVSNGYAILQSNKEAQWKDISVKKAIFRDVFLDNQPVGLNDENPLEYALNALKTSENEIWRGRDYRERYDWLAMKFGPNTFYWDAEKKSWRPNPKAKPEGIAALKDPFSDEKKFPKEDVELDDGTIIPGVSRKNRLRTVMGMLYRDRNDKNIEIAALRSQIVERDLQLRESQNLFNDMKTQKEEWEAKSNDFELKLQNTEADLAEEKKLRYDEKEALEQQLEVLRN